jgi:hypothetical protein
MELNQYSFTKESLIKSVYNMYLMGHSVEEIYIKHMDSEFNLDDINNIIDCKNYLEL